MVVSDSFFSDFSFFGHFTGITSHHFFSEYSRSLFLLKLRSERFVCFLQLSFSPGFGRASSVSFFSKSSRFRGVNPCFTETEVFFSNDGFVSHGFCDLSDFVSFFSTDENSRFSREGGRLVVSFFHFSNDGFPRAHRGAGAGVFSTV